MSQRLDRLWAPWRLAYIKDGARPKSACPFCSLPRTTPSEKNLVLYRDNRISVLMNKFPYNPGHLLVIPRKHVGDPTELDSETWTALNAALQAATAILKKVMNPQGFNLGMNVGAAAGAGIPKHLHWHILPRWGGDTNFMPLLAETKTIPTHNATVYKQLKPFFSSFDKKLPKAKTKVRKK